MKTTSIILTALCAGAGGAVAGTLFAPGKGSKTRSKIAKRGKEYKAYIVDNYNDIANSVSHPFENLKEETMRLSKKANAKATKVKAELKNNK